VFEDESLRKVVVLYPLLPKDTLTIGVKKVARHGQGLVLRFVLEPSDNIKETLAKLQQEFLNVVEPPVAALLHSGQVLMR
jgi:hypothetical protein